MKSKLHINFSSIKYGVKDFFDAHKTAYIICASFILIGLITGFLTAFKFSDMVTTHHLTDTSLIEYLRHNSGWMGLLISRIFSFLFICALIFILCLNKWCSIFTAFILVYKAYLIGLNSAIFIILFNISGAINVFIVYLPCSLLYLFALLSITAIILSKCWEFAKYKQCINCYEFWSVYCNPILICCLIALLGFLLEIILLPTFCSAFFLAF